MQISWAIFLPLLWSLERCEDELEDLFILVLVWVWVQGVAGIALYQQDFMGRNVYSLPYMGVG